MKILKDHHHEQQCMVNEMCARKAHACHASEASQLQVLIIGKLPCRVFDFISLLVCFLALFGFILFWQI